MKKFLILCCLFIYGGKASAQRFNGFLSGGMTTSQVSGDALGGFDKAGVRVGGGVTTPLSRTITATFEISYIQKGSRKPSKLDQGDPTYYRLRLNYLEIPLAFGYMLNEKFEAYLGPSVGYLIGMSEEDENGEVSYSLPFNDWDISVTGGLRYKAGDHFRINIAGFQSVLPVRDFDGEDLPFLESGQYNSVITLGVEYCFKKL